MPELPEVEIASRHLRAWLGGRRIVRARAARSRVLRGQDPRRFAALAGRQLDRLERTGKWMLLSFDRGEGLVSHLGMTGKWIRRAGEARPAPHTRATLELDDGSAVDYRDPRMFGLLLRGKADALRALPGLVALGPDPLAGIDVGRLHAVLRRTRRSLKEALLDQRTLAGLGNIYAAEALHRAQLDPRRAGTSVTLAEAARLAGAIDATLRAALLEADGPAPITYVEEGGENTFLVYDREDEPCPRCGTPITRIVQGGRSTFFCPACQAGGRRALRPLRRSTRADTTRPAGRRPPARP